MCCWGCSLMQSCLLHLMFVLFVTKQLVELKEFWFNCDWKIRQTLLRLLWKSICKADLSGCQIKKKFFDSTTHFVSGRLEF